MKLIFLRHGEGKHNTNEPESFQIIHPGLTKKGIIQAKSLKNKFKFTESDIVICSPTIRTIDTAKIITSGSNCLIKVAYELSPRIFPYRNQATTLPCDEVLNFAELKQRYPDLDILNIGSKEMKESFSINTIGIEDFKKIALAFINWCKLQKMPRIFLVSHDGTINSFKELILNKTFTREDMLDEGGFIELHV